jgi:hypothetical protein
VDEDDAEAVASNGDTFLYPGSQLVVTLSREFLRMGQQIQFYATSISLAGIGVTYEPKFTFITSKGPQY